MKDFLTASEIQNLRLAHKKEKRKKFADRIKILLALNAGYSYQEVAVLYLLDDETIRRYEKSYQEKGIEGLLSTDYQGGFPRLSEEQEEKLSIHLDLKTYLSTKEVAAYIYQSYGFRFSLSGTRVLLKRLGFTYKKPQCVPGNPMKALQEEFLKHYKKLSKRLKKQKEVLYFGDAVHPTLSGKAAYGWILKGKRQELKTSSGRQRVNIQGALSIEKREVIIEESTSINAQSTIVLFKRLLEKNKNSKKVHIVADNARYYHSKLVQSFVKKTKIKIHFLPSYSPNLNLIERLWKYFYKKVISNQYYEKFTLFRNSIFLFFKTIKDQWNELSSLLTPHFHLIGNP